MAQGDLVLVWVWVGKAGVERNRREEILSKWQLCRTPREPNEKKEKGWVVLFVLIG